MCKNGILIYMKQYLKKGGTVLAFLLVIFLIIYSIKVNKDKEKAFEASSIQTEKYAETTRSRIADAVVTLPDGDLVVGLSNNVSEYQSQYGTEKSKVELESQFLKTEFIPGDYKKKVNPRLDAIVPMTVSIDSLGGSTFIVLFEDRGDVVLEKSYARIGKSSAIIKTLTFLAKDPDVIGQDYRISVIYTDGSGTDREVIIPVISGHFDPNEVVLN